MSSCSLHTRRQSLAPTSLVCSAQACLVLAMVQEVLMQCRGQKETVSAFCIPPLSLQNQLSVSCASANLSFSQVLEQQQMVAGAWGPQPALWFLPLGKEPWFHYHWVPESQWYFRGRYRSPGSCPSLLLRFPGTVESLGQEWNCCRPILKDRAEAGDSSWHYQPPTVDST